MEGVNRKIEQMYTSSYTNKIMIIFITMIFLGLPLFSIYVCNTKQPHCYTHTSLTAQNPNQMELTLYREHQPHKTQKAAHQRPQTPSTEIPIPKNLIQDPNNKTQSQIHHKRENMTKKYSE